MAAFRTLRHFAALSTAFLLGAASSLSLFAAAKPQEGPPQLSDYTTGQINEFLRPALDKKDWQQGLAILQRMKAKAAPGSYDLALTDGIYAQTYLQLSPPNLKEALESLKAVVRITDRHPNYFSPKDNLENIYNISQIAYQIGAGSKDPKVANEYFAETLSYLQRWIDATNPRKYTENNYQFISSVYFTLGQGIGADGKQQTNPQMMRMALKWINRGLRSAIVPREVFYQLKISALFQLSELKEGAEYLELSLQEKPDNKSYWQQLAFSYVQLADDAQKKHDTKDFFTYTVRAILTMERAQQHGFMNTPKDNYQVVGMYFNINQYGKACDLLARDLRNGQIKSTVENWQLLAYSYQQQHKDADAINTLMEATRRFPKSGLLEYQLAQVYYGGNHLKEALKHIKLCVDKGGLKKPGLGWYFYAVIAYNLKEYDTALKAAAQAAKYPDTKKEAVSIEKGVQASIQDQKNRAQAAAENITAY